MFSLNVLMETANKARVKVTFKCLEKDLQRDDVDEVNDGNLWDNFLGEYVFPPTTASLRMCCGKRVFELIHEVNKLPKLSQLCSVIVFLIIIDVVL